MKHSIISWDCSFRNFFNLVDGLLYQDYPRSDFELIYVEQRSQDTADRYNHMLGLKSLWDRYEEVKDKINISIYYLNDPLKVPYHLGKCNNYGISKAKGEIISIMDGDLLLPRDFLHELAQQYEQEDVVLNLHRLMCERPVNASLENWVKGEIDFEKCLEVCPNKDNPIPKVVSNKGPMISAKRKFWQMINGYDPNPIWSTSTSKSGVDVNTRLEIAAKSSSRSLEKSFAVHPWHPVGYAAANREKLDSLAKKILNIQTTIIEYSTDNNIWSWEDRISFSQQLVDEHKDLLEEVITEERKHEDKLYKTTTIGFSPVRKIKNLVKHILGKKIYYEI